MEILCWRTGLRLVFDLFSSLIHDYTTAMNRTLMSAIMSTALSYLKTLKKTMYLSQG